MKKIALILALAVLLVSICWLINYQQQVSAQEGAKFIGIDKCKGCHKKEYEDFQARKFAKAWAVLQMRGKTTDPECLKCHATGYGQPGGFVSEEQTPHLKYKQCEACHGPGSLHAKDPSNKEALVAMRNYVRDKDVCIQCHVCMKTHKSEEF